MATVQPVKGKRGITYRVQFMRDSRRVSKTFKLKKDAQKFAAAIIVDDDYAHSHANYTLNTLTMAEAISQYKAQLVTADQSALHRLAFWADTFNGQAIGKVTKPLVKAELKKLLAIGRAPATANRYKAALSAVFTWLADAHHIEHNPAKGIRQETENNARTRFLSGAELPRLMKAAKDSEWDRLYLLILMAVTTGARRTEMLSLKWSDIDLKTRTAHLSKTKNGEQRVLTLTQDLVDELMRFREVGRCTISLSAAR